MCYPMNHPLALSIQQIITQRNSDHLTLFGLRSPVNQNIFQPKCATSIAARVYRLGNIWLLVKLFLAYVGHRKLATLREQTYSKSCLLPEMCELFMYEASALPWHCCVSG